MANVLTAETTAMITLPNLTVKTRHAWTALTNKRIVLKRAVACTAKTIVMNIWSSFEMIIKHATSVLTKEANMLKKEQKLANASLAATTERIIPTSSETRTRPATTASREEANMPKKEPKMAHASLAATTETITQRDSKMTIRPATTASRNKGRSTKKEKETPARTPTKNILVLHHLLLLCCLYLFKMVMSILVRYLLL